MDKKEVIAYKFKAFIVRLFKENTFTNVNFKSCLEKIILNHKNNIYEYFYDDIINLVLLIGDIDFLTLEKYFYARYNSKLTKEYVIHHIDAYCFFFTPIDRLLWWERTKEGFEYWRNKNLEYQEMIKIFC